MTVEKKLLLIFSRKSKESMLIYGCGLGSKERQQIMLEIGHRVEQEHGRHKLMREERSETTETKQ